MSTINAASPSRTDVAAAIAAAVTGDIVVVPSGSATWTTGVTISGKAIAVRAAVKGACLITHSANAPLFTIVSNSGGHVEIANFTFLAGTPTNPDYMDVSGTGQAVIIRDNYFRVSSTTQGINWSAIGGIIWNNVFESLDVNGASGICLLLKSIGYTTSWTTASTMGSADSTGAANVYVENNTFRKIYRQAIVVDDNQRAVIRYNTFDNSAILCIGADVSTYGARHIEIFNNTFRFTAVGPIYNYPLDLNYWVSVRGGTGVIFSNTMPQEPSLDNLAANTARSLGTTDNQWTTPNAQQVVDPISGNVIIVTSVGVSMINSANGAIVTGPTFGGGGVDGSTGVIVYHENLDQFYIFLFTGSSTSVRVWELITDCSVANFPTSTLTELTMSGNRPVGTPGQTSAFAYDSTNENIGGMAGTTNVSSPDSTIFIFNAAGRSWVQRTMLIESGSTGPARATQNYMLFGDGCYLFRDPSGQTWAYRA